MDELLVEEMVENDVLDTSDSDGVVEADEALNDNEDEEDVISIAGETPPVQEEESHRAPEWVRELRRKHREQTEEVKKLRAELDRVNTPAPKAEIPKKPKLEDFDYDSELYEEAIDAWHIQLKENEKKNAQQQRELEAKQAEWNDVVENYNKAKSSLRVRDYEVAEDVVTEGLTIEQQAVILQGAENPASLVYVIGKDKSKLEELSKIKDPVKFAFALAKLESKLSIERRKSPPPPEKVVRGSANASGVDSALERLREEASRTGDYSKVFAYKQTQKNKDR